LATVVGVVANLGGHIQLPNISVADIATVVTVIASLTSLYAGLSILIRFTLAALSRVRLGKDDIYFVVALAVAIGSALSAGCRDDFSPFLVA